jgi:ribonuclease HII
MVEFEREYPGYAFEQHKGYGTAGHRAALTRLGPCALHRMSYAPLKILVEIAG